jgi:citrate lyase subunit beta/citryl-CoA lyase
VKSLFGASIEEQVRDFCQEVGVREGVLEIEDFGALPWVVDARLEAAMRGLMPSLEREQLVPMQPFSDYPSSRDRFRRSRLYLPGNQPKFMLNAGIHRPDAIILDLEDSVAPEQKEETRYVVRNALRSVDFFGSERMVRINQGDLGLQDLEMVVPHNVHLILIPKVEDAEQVQGVEKSIGRISDECGRRDPVYLMPIIESARGVLKALEIAEASAANVALAIGLEDYTADIGVPRTLGGRESYFARSMIVQAARAAGIQAIDTVFSDVTDMEGLKASVREAKALGFDGKGCIHPRQIRPIHEAFAPTEEEIDKARRIVEAYELARAQGLGVVALGSKMIDPPVVQRAQRTIQIAEATGVQVVSKGRGEPL